MSDQIKDDCCACKLADPPKVLAPRRGRMDAGARLPITHLAHYGLIFISCLIALSAMGVQLKNITIISVALGVGIGFGIQALVNDFVSGRTFPFECSLKADGSRNGRGIPIRFRKATAKTVAGDKAVPSGDLLISGQRISQAQEDRSIRLVIPVRVADGSDVETVLRIITQVASDNGNVLKTPVPSVGFVNFADNALDFELSVWVADINDGASTQNCLKLEIDRRFREESIDIPFSHPHLHFRGMDDEAVA